MSIADKIARGQVVDCYSQFGSSDFCEHCPIAEYCRKAKNDDRGLHSREKWKCDSDVSQQYEDDNSSKQKLVVSSESEKVAQTVIAAIFSLSPLEFSVVKTRLTEHHLSAEEISKRHGCPNVRGVISNACEKIPLLERAMLFSWKGVLRKKHKTKRLPVVCIETGECFRSVRQAAISVGAWDAALAKKMAKQESCNGYHFRYLTDEEMEEKYFGSK